MSEHEPVQPARQRVRLVSVTVALDVVADDGEILHPIPTQPIRIAASEWRAFSLDVVLGQLQAQIEPR